MTSSARTGTVSILLHDDPVGDIVVLSGDRTEFSFRRGYVESHPRPVLGQAFEDDLRVTHRAKMRLPPFFSNLLPEDRLRELAAEQIGVAPQREALLLAWLGEDLPGAVRAVAEGDLPLASERESAPVRPDHAHPLKFSLAGMQPKLSMVRSGRGLTFPATGLGGDWIVKLPSPRYERVPENEHVTMAWARESGIQVPETALVAVQDLENLPPELRQESGQAFAIRRYDRPTAGARIHAEDFAQVLGLYPTHADKYGKANYETIGRIVRTLDEPSFAEFLLRLVFVVLSANGDAHVKNWSLWYPDRVRPALAPAYDLVSTIELIPRDALALNLAGSKEWAAVRKASFESMAGRIGADPAEVVARVLDATRAILDAWPRVATGAPPLLRDRLEAHWKRVPLVAEAAASTGG